MDMHMKTIPLRMKPSQISVECKYAAEAYAQSLFFLHWTHKQPESTKFAIAQSRSIHAFSLVCKNQGTLTLLS